MASTNDSNMVLRTVFFPPDLDDKLRDFAFSNRVSKGDLIRQLIIQGLAVEVSRGLQTVPEKLLNAKRATSASTVAKSSRKGAALGKKIASPSRRAAAKKPIKKLVAKKAAKKAAR